MLTYEIGMVRAQLVPQLLRVGLVDGGPQRPPPGDDLLHVRGVDRPGMRCPARRATFIFVFRCDVPQCTASAQRSGAAMCIWAYGAGAGHMRWSVPFRRLAKPVLDVVFDGFM